MIVDLSRRLQPQQEIVAIRAVFIGMPDTVVGIPGLARKLHLIRITLQFGYTNAQIIELISKFSR